MIVWLYVVVALLLIRDSHSTGQATMNFGLFRIEKDLRQERPIYKSGMSLRLALAQDKPYDIVCDKLTVDEKKSLCDQAMVLMINQYWSGRKIPGGSFASFVDAESTLDVPQLANPRDPYTCTEIRAEFDNIWMIRDMYWCPHRPYKNKNSDEILQWEGFFIMGSRLVLDKAYLFRPPEVTDPVVLPVAKMESIEILSRYAPGSSSASSETHDDPPSIEKNR